MGYSYSVSALEAHMLQTPKVTFLRRKDGEDGLLSKEKLCKQWECVFLHAKCCLRLISQKSLSASFPLSYSCWSSAFSVFPRVLSICKLHLWGLVENTRNGQGMEEEQASSRRNKAGNQTRWSLSFSPDETRTIARQSSCGHLHLTFSTPQKSPLKGKKGCFYSRAKYEWSWLGNMDAICPKMPTSSVETVSYFSGWKTREGSNEGHWVGGLPKQGRIDCRHQTSSSNILVEDKPFAFSASWDCYLQFSHNL